MPLRLVTENYRQDVRDSMAHDQPEKKRFLSENLYLVNLILSRQKQPQDCDVSYKPIIPVQPIDENDFEEHDEIHVVLKDDTVDDDCWDDSYYSSFRCCYDRMKISSLRMALSF